LSGAGLGALGSGIGTAAEALLADKFIKDDVIRASLAKLRAEDILKNMAVGAFCGAVAGLVPGFGLDDIMGVAERCAMRAFGGSGATSSFFWMIEKADFAKLSTFVFCTRVSVQRFKAIDAAKEYYATEDGSEAREAAEEKLIACCDAEVKARQEYDHTLNDLFPPGHPVRQKLRLDNDNGINRENNSKDENETPAWQLIDTSDFSECDEEEFKDCLSSQSLIKRSSNDQSFR